MKLLFRRKLRLYPAKTKKDNRTKIISFFNIVFLTSSNTNVKPPCFLETD